jgi:carbamate kinase
MQKKRVVLALGGNALTTKHNFSYETQLNQIEKTAKIVADLVKKDYLITITHGNGPQVGSILLQNETPPSMPIDVCGAESQAQIGYMLQQALKNEFAKRRIKKDTVTLITQILVETKDPAFKTPSKPIGPFYSRQQIIKFKHKYRFKLIPGKGFRRVVPSPEPKDIIELDLIKKLANDVVVICCGGGGIPVIKEGKDLAGVRAVIDKDKAAALLANKLKADILLILTDVDAVYKNYNTSGQEKLAELSPATARCYLVDGQFPEGSMGPKIEAAIAFKKKSIITTIDKAELALQGKAGTVIA